MEAPCTWIYTPENSIKIFSKTVGAKKDIFLYTKISKICLEITKGIYHYEQKVKNWWIMKRENENIARQLLGIGMTTLECDLWQFKLFGIKERILYWKTLSKKDNDKLDYNLSSPFYLFLQNFSVEHRTCSYFFPDK